MQAAVGSADRLGNDEDKQKPLKSELQETQPDSVPGANQGEIHYGMAHAETVKRLQARRAARAKKEARGTAAAKRPAGKRATGKAATEKTARAKTATTGRASKTAGAASEDRPSRTAKTAVRKTPATRSEPAAETAQTRTGRTAAKQGLLGRALGTVAKTALGTVSRGSKGLARAAALAKEVRAGKGGKAEAKPEKSGGRTGKKR
ncbi:hypothetical protein HPC49_32375 [Pyxidicoccus fallax]|nr:hypothetical protein [Pyxidicoccus fallax]NPC82906.1 hypothetical protein [Pyxidicoccus fallax]